MKKNIFFLLLFSFSINLFSAGNNIQYKKYEYTSSFMDRVRGVGMWLGLEYKLGWKERPDGFTIPIKIWVGYAWDFAMLTIRSGSSYQGFDVYIGQNVRCGRVGYANISVVRFGSSGIGKAGYSVPEDYYADCGGYFWNNINIAGNNVHNMLLGASGIRRPVVIGSGYIKNPSGSGGYFQIVTGDDDFKNRFNSVVAVNLPNEQIYGTLVMDYVSDREVDKYRNLYSSGTIPDYSSAKYYNDFLDYKRNGYIDGTSEVIRSTTPYEVIEDSLTLISPPEGLGTDVQNVLVVNFPTEAIKVDIGTVTVRDNYTKDIYDFLTSTATLGVDYSQFCSSCIISQDVNLSSAVHTTSTTIWGAYTDLENYFSTNFNESIVWDCKFHFSTITFLGTPIVLGDVDLCENYGEYFNFLKALLRLGFIVTGCFIFCRGVM